MKKNIIKMCKIFLAMIILFLTYCFFDYQTHDKNNFINKLSCYNDNSNMPFGISPVFHSEYPQHFDLIDDEGFEIMGSGFRYSEMDFTIKKFLAYGFNDTSIIIECTDSLNRIRFVRSYKTGFRTKKGNPEIGFREINTSSFFLDKQNYHWNEVCKK